MKTFKVSVTKEYTTWATIEYVIKAKNEDEIVKAIDRGGIAYKYSPMSIKNDLDEYKGLNASANGHEELLDIEEMEETL
jgi:hypothetical protein